MMGEKPGRNAPCWCGSGKKYKRCHLDADALAEREAAAAPAASTDPTVDPELAGALIELAGPLLDRLGPEDVGALERLATIAAAAWNLEILVRLGDEPGAATLRDKLRQMPTPNVIEGVVAGLMDRKRELFAADDRRITEVRAVAGDGGARLLVR